MIQKKARLLAKLVAGLMLVMPVIALAETVDPSEGGQQARQGKEQTPASPDTLPASNEHSNDIRLFGAAPRALTAVTPRTSGLDFTANSDVSYAGVGTPGAFNPTAASVTAEETGEGWGWDHHTKTLTLAGANITADAGAFAVKLPAGGSVELAAGTESIITGPSSSAGNTSGLQAEDLTINGSGRLTVAGGAATGKSYGIYAEKDMIISGSAKVDATGGQATDGSSYGIYSYAGDITLNTTGAVHAAAGDAASTSAGIYVFGNGGGGNLTIDAGSVTTKSGNVTSIGGKSAGVDATQNITVNGSANLTAETGTATAGVTYGIQSFDGSIILNTSGAVQVTAKDSKLMSVGIYVRGNGGNANDALHITAGNVTAKSGNVANKSGGSYGVYVYGDVTASNAASLTAEGGIGGSSYGVYSYAGNITLSSTGAVRAAAQNAEHRGAGIFAAGGKGINGNILITAGTVTAQGGTVTAEDGQSAGICAITATISGSGKVSAKGGEATGKDGESYGVYSDRENVTIGGSADVTAQGGTGGYRSGGIWSGKQLVMEDQAIVKAQGGASPKGQSNGLRAAEQITLASTGVITAIGGQGEDGSAGMGSGTIVITAGNVTSTGGVAEKKGSSYGIFGSQGIEISGGVVSAASDAADESYSLCSLVGTIAIKEHAVVAAKSGQGETHAGIYADLGLTVTPAADGAMYVYTGDNGFDTLLDTLHAAKTYARGDLTAAWLWVGAEQPFPVMSDGSRGWSMVLQNLDAATEGTFTLDLSSQADQIVPIRLFQSIAGKDVTLRVDLGNGFVWTVSGRDVNAGSLGSLTRLNLGASFLEPGAISEDLLKTVPQGLGSLQFQLAHEGAFPFALRLTVPVGDQYNGQWSNLYYYNQANGTLDGENSAQVVGGTATHSFRHASTYLLVMDDHNHFEQITPLPENPEEPVQPGNEPGNGSQSGGNPGTGDPFSVGLLAIMAVGAVGGAVWAEKKRR